MLQRETYTGGSPFQFLFLVPFLGEPQRVDGICSGKHQSACLLSSIEIVLAPASSSTDVSVTLNSFDTIATEDNSLGLPKKKPKQMHMIALGLIGGYKTPRGRPSNTREDE
ncbi:unnamed protein product [Cuscuta campestris]|uniref:Uncharacterized protein n=1 Tax=Cuscuta campestris TaxID=132261 RepID=A0A484ML36_9ASTE|nr:unnamed protein product [Cuscuta campestris]